MPMQDEVAHINKMFKEFNLENKLMIDSLSYETGFETLEGVSSNLINEMDKEHEDNYMDDMLNNLQSQWRTQLLGNQSVINTNN